MSRSSAKATNADTTPIATASPEIGKSRVVVVKSPSTSHDLLGSLLAGSPLGAREFVSVLLLTLASQFLFDWLLPLLAGSWFARLC